jgi:glucosamine kinase
VVGVILSVDGGASKVMAVLFDESSFRVAGIGFAGSANFKNVGVSVAKRNVSEAVSEALLQGGANLDDIGNAVFGVAGVGDSGTSTETVRNIVAELMRGKGFRLENDGILANKLTNLDADGAVYAAGTGAVGYYQKSGVVQRVGGWGWFSGDEGSAFWIARNALNKATRSYDRVDPPTYLIDATEKYTGLSFREAIAKIHLDHPVTYVAGFAPYVSQLAYEGDVLAAQVLESAAEQISLMLKRMYKEFEKPPETSLVGGVVQAGNILVSRISTSLKTDVRIYHGYEVAVGGLIMVLSEKGHSVDKQTRESLLKDFNQMLRSKDKERLLKYLYFSVGTKPR